MITEGNFGRDARMTTAALAVGMILMVGGKYATKEISSYFSKRNQTREIELTRKMEQGPAPYN